MFDFIMIHFLEKWKRRNRDKIMEWIEITGHTDAMISLSGFAWNHPEFTQPKMEEKQGPLEVKGLGHPLIAADKRVVNDLLINYEKVVIITGANMAGKSTFLRSLGINTLLAYTGCPVCATTFRIGFMGLYSSMRTADSLADEESYFLAEIKKLQKIVQRMEKGDPMLILLDEVLKGTNTTDKKLGSIGLIKRSLPHPVCCFIATHDLSLGEMEEQLPGKVVNYCFESFIKGSELTFDYTIRKGIATNMNASFLMKQMGIMD
jgi:DNA mismatch repair ATPase MutS